MKLKNALPLLAAATLLAPALAAQTLSGTAHPESLDDNISTATPASSDHYVKPSHDLTQDATAAVTTSTYAPADPGAPAPVLEERRTVTTTTTDTYAPPEQADALTPTYGASPALRNRNDRSLQVTDDVNSGIVMPGPSGPNELPSGTLLRASLMGNISTQGGRAGAPFSAQLATSVFKDGHILLPVGSMVYGRVTEIHGGRRISGGAAIRLQPDTITLPNGQTYSLHAQVADLDHFEDSKVNSEGTIVSNGHGKETAAILGATTGTAAVAGAVIGGGVGAVVGASIGAGVATVWWLKQDRQQTLPQGTSIVFSLDAPLQVEASTPFPSPSAL